MKLTTYTDSNGKAWETAEMRPMSDGELIAPTPKFEYYSIKDVEKHGELWAHYANSYDRYIVYYCVRVRDYNEFIDQYLNDCEV